MPILSSGGSFNLFAVNPGLVIWTCITFLIVFLVLRRFAWGPIAKALDERAAKIQGDLERAEGIRREAERKLGEYEKRFGEMEREGQQVVARAREESLRVQEEMLEKAREEAEAIRKRSQRDLELARDQALKELHQEVVTLSVGIASQILGRSLRSEDHRKFVEEAIQEAGKN